MEPNFAPLEIQTDRQLAALNKVAIGHMISDESQCAVEKTFFENHLPFIYGQSLERVIEPSLSAIVGKSESVYLFTAKNVKVAGFDSVCVIDDCRAVRSTTAFLLSHIERSHFRYFDGALFMRQHENCRKLHGSYFLGFTAPYTNYAHWTTDTLPLWVYFRENYCDGNVRLLLPNNIFKFQKEALSVLGIADSQIMFIDDEFVICDEIIMSSPISLWSVPDLVLNSAEKIERIVAPKNGMAKRRIFLSRGDVKKRILLNEDEALELLLRHGFEFLRASELTFGQQVGAMAQSEIVMAIHGAAFANCIYCKPRSHVVEIFPEYCVQPHFRAFAARKGLKYSAIYGTSFEFEDSRRNLNAWDQNFVIDIDALEHCILKIEADLSLK